VPLVGTPRCNILYTLVIQFNVHKEKERERFWIFFLYLIDVNFFYSSSFFLLVC
jgi:hypothetical protein